MTDLRKDKRAPASLKVKYKSATVGEFAEQFGSDVSRGGIFVKTKKPIENGAVLKLELQLSDASKVIHGIGRVCWRREPGPDPDLPAGMGIKFIKLDPESRTVVDRIVQGRGDGPSRFEQTQGAEIAQASSPPPPSAAALPAAKATPPQARPAAPAVAAMPRATTPSAAASAARPAAPRAAAPPAAATPRAAGPPIAVSTPAVAPAPRVPSPAAAVPRADLPPPAASVLRAGSAAAGSLPGSRPGTTGGPTVAGLFANTAISNNPPQEPSGELSTRSSFFPPAPSPNGSGSLGSGRLAPSPPSAGGPPAKRQSYSGSAGLRPSGRADQARQSGQFLAAAFAEGGVAEETATQARAVAESSEDALIDELFAGVVDEPARPRPTGGGQGPSPIEPGSVDDVFAALSKEEGLVEPPSDRRVLPSRASAPSGIARGRASSPGPAAPMRANETFSRSARASQPDSVDALFAELDERENVRASSPGSATAVASPALAERERGPDTHEVDDFGADSGDEFGEADLFGVTGAPQQELPLRASDMAPAPLVASTSRPLAGLQRWLPVLRWGVPLLLAVGIAAGFLNHQQSVMREQAVRPAPIAAPVVAAPVPAPAAATPQPAKGATEPQGASAPAGDPGAKPAQTAAEKAPPSAPGETNVVESLELEISSLPRDSDISVDGKRVGTTPKHVPLPLGREAHVTVSSAGYAAMTKTVVMSATTEPLRFRLEPLPFALVVRTTPPQAELTVGKQTVISPAPLELGHLDGGVQISVAKEGYQRMTRSVTIDEFAEKDGVMRAEIALTLSPLPAGWQAVARQHKRSHPKPEPAELDTAPPAPSEPPPPSNEAAPKAASQDAPSDAQQKAAASVPNENKPAPEGPAPQAAPPTLP